MIVYGTEVFSPTRGGDVEGGGGGGGGIRDKLYESPANFLFMALIVGSEASDKLVVQVAYLNKESQSGMCSGLSTRRLTCYRPSF